jgi:uncharacterized protein (DUF433 family)
MSLTIAVDPVPLRSDERGIYRVGATRVTLDTVVGAFKDGATPEEIVQQFDTLDLGDVYAVLSYYLHHRAEVENYLSRQEDVARQLQTELEGRAEVVGIRDRLLARQQKRG